jgi:hypothetical protein
MGTAGPSNRASLLLGHCAGVFAKQIERAALLVVALWTIVVLTTGVPQRAQGLAPG